MAERSRSAPGPSRVPYRVPKQCPKLLVRLWKILKVFWQRGKQLPNGDQPRGFVLRTHRSGEPVDPGGKEDQRRPCRTLDGSYQCLRVHSPQAGQRSTDKTSCTRDDPQHHSGLLQQVQIESFIRNGNICQATATKKTSLPAAQSRYHSSL